MMGFYPRDLADFVVGFITRGCDSRSTRVFVVVFMVGGVRSIFYVVVGLACWCQWFIVILLFLTVVLCVALLVEFLQ